MLSKQCLNLLRADDILFTQRLGRGADFTDGVEGETFIPDCIAVEDGERAFDPRLRGPGQRQGVEPFLNPQDAYIAQVVMPPPWFDVALDQAEMRCNARKGFPLREQFTLLVMGNEVADLLRCCGLKVDGVTKKEQGLLRIAALLKLDLCEQIMASLKTA